MYSYIAKFHLMGNTQLLILLNGRTCQPEGLCQLFTFVTFQYQRNSIVMLFVICSRVLMQIKDAVMQ